MADETYRVVGLCAATFTPLSDDKSINTSAIPTYVDQLAEDGVKYVFVNGTTGESLLLTVDERKTLLEAWVAAAAGKLSVICHVGCESLEDTLELVRHAKATGVDAIGAMPSVFFKASSIPVLVEWMAAISAAAPSLPLYYYHIPIMTGVDIRCDKMLEAIDAAGTVPSFRGVKYTDFNLHMFQNCVDYAGGKYDMLYGRDEQMLGALAMGAKGFVGSTYNYMGPVYVQLMAAFESGDLVAARAHMRVAQKWVNVLMQGSKYGPAAYTGKDILALRGTPIGPPRLPRLPLTEDGTAKLKADLEEIGFFTWLKK